MEERYRKFSTYLKERFGTRVHKVSVDAGFSCPNRDGRISTEGCIYCDNQAFNFQARSSERKPLLIQIEEGIKAARDKFKANKFIVYFQAHTNTYAPLKILKQRYDVIRNFKDVVGLSIATRPDCIDDDILNLIEGYSDSCEVWIEYGLQTIHDKTLTFINRGHSFGQFLKAVKLTRRYKIKICAHLIIGLPFETKEMLLETAKAVTELRLDGVKIHPLHIVKGTKMEELYRQGQYLPLEIDRYLELLCDFISCLHPETVIQRVGAYCPPELLAAPEWVSKKNIVERELDKLLAEKGFSQGSFLRPQIKSSFFF